MGIMRPIEDKSERWTLNQQDVLVWLKWSLAFFAPTILLILNGLQNGMDTKTIETSAAYSLYASLTYLFKKFQDK